MSLAIKCIRFLTQGSTLNSLRCLSTRASANIPPATSVLPHFQFSNSWIWRKPEPLQLPINNIKPMNLPDDLLRIHPLIEPVNINVTEKIIDDPLSINNTTKEAVRLMIIRRKKMKKHKLKKLRKRMKYEWAKLRQRRELKKEKEFQATLIAQCKEAEAFSAEEYVLNKLKQATEKPPPAFRDTPEYKELMRQKRLRLNVNK